MLKVYNPFRLNYKHDYHAEKCPFCNPKIIKKQNIEVLNGKYWLVFINYYPILDGNLMLVSKRHIEDTAELTHDEWIELKEKIEQLKNILSKVFNTVSFNIGFNVGPYSGASVKHLHWQIIPRLNYLPVNGIAGFIAGIHVVRISPKELKERILKQIEQNNLKD